MVELKESGLISWIHRRKTVSWQHPAVRALVPVIDSVDRVVRNASSDGRSNVPRYSERIRSNGMRHQFGGRLFLDSGRADVAALVKQGVLSSRTDVLDIGCGVGRLTTALVDVLESGTYIGLDVDQPSIQSCTQNLLFREPTFHFEHLDAASELYNPSGGEDSRSISLPLATASRDLIVAMSLFTHLFTKECENYAREMLRILRPGGAIVVTALLIDPDSPVGDFRHDVNGAHVSAKNMPRKGVAYTRQDVTRWFGPDHMLLRGRWHADGVFEAPRQQDWVVVRPHERSSP